MSQIRDSCQYLKVCLSTCKSTNKDIVVWKDPNISVMELIILRN